MRFVNIFLTLLLFTFVMQSAVAASKRDTGLQCLETAILMEAGNQPRLGREAVAMVVYNRADRNVNNICKVVKARKQFSWYKGGSVNKYRAKDSRRVVIRLEARDFLSQYKHSKAFKNKRLRTAKFFHATYVSPYWKNSFCKPTRVKDHIFYSPCIT